MTKPIITGPAGEDLQEILDYINSQSMQNALLVWERFDKALSKIAETPGIGHRREEIRDPTVRVYSVSGYLIVYDATLVPVHILRILRGARGLDRL